MLARKYEAANGSLFKFYGTGRLIPVSIVKFTCARVRYAYALGVTLKLCCAMMWPTENPSRMKSKIRLRIGHTILSNLYGG